MTNFNPVQYISESSRQDEFKGEPAERILIREQRRDLQLVSSFLKYTRLLSKLAYREEFVGDTKHRTTAYIDVREDPSIGSTHKLPLEVEFRKKSTVIILVAPQMGENIGATARAMKNFGLSNLRIVAPRDGWPNEQARSNAVGAVDIIDSAEIYDSLEDSIKDLEYLYATTCIRRVMNKDYVFSQNLTSDYPYSAKVGIMFGRENNGLSNEEISLANKIITINTTEFSSLNIAQAVIIICYELFRTSPTREDIYNTQKLASKEEIGYFLENLFTKLDKKGFFKAPEKKAAMQQNITNIFMRINNLSRSEIKTLQGIIKSLNNS